MREVLLLVLIAVLSVVALARPRVGALAYIWFALMRPDVLAWSDTGRYSSSLAVCTLIGSIRYWPRLSVLLRNPIALGLLLFQVPLALSVICAIDSDLALDSYTRFLPTVVMALLTLMLTDTVERLRQLLLVIALSVGFLGLRFGLYGVVHGGVRFSMGHGGLMADNNDLALGLAMVVPLCWYGCDMVRQRWLKLLFLIFVVFTIAAIVMTYSRGGALSLIVAIALVGFRSRRKGLVVAFFALITVPIGYLVGNAYWDRLATIQDPTEEASARSRFVFAEAALECAKDYPLVGVGFGGRNFMLIENKYVEAEQSLMAHNTYLQVLVDSGVMALFMYSGLLFGTILWLGKAAAIAKREMPGQELYPRAIQASLCAFAVGATFLSRVTFDMTYFLLIAAGALLVIQRTTRAAQLQGDEEV